MKREEIPEMALVAGMRARWEGVTDPLPLNTPPTYCVSEPTTVEMKLRGSGVRGGEGYV